MSYASHLYKKGFQVVAIPKTMDNDVFGTDFGIGFSGAVPRSVDSINALRTTAGSHERICAVEFFGGNSGETPLLPRTSPTGINIIYQQLAYIMRSGAPDSLDRMVPYPISIRLPRAIQGGWLLFIRASIQRCLWTLWGQRRRRWM